MKILSRLKIVSKKIAVTEVKRTPKAVLVEKDGKQGWVQNRSFKDGMVEQKVFDKAVEFMELRQQIKKENKEWRNSYHTLIKGKETEKAFGAIVELDFYDLEQDKKEIVWFPKSQANPENPNQFKGWLIDAKTDELREKYPFSKYGGFSVDWGLGDPIF